MTLTQLYIFTVILPNIHSTFSVLSFLALLAFVIATIIYGITSCVALEDESALKAMPYVKYGFKFILVLAAVCTFLDVVTPSDKQLYTVAGGYVATNTKDVAKLPDNVVKAANAWLEKAATAAEDKPAEQPKEQKKKQD